jgi:flagellar assembly protein FliH
MGRVVKGAQVAQQAYRLKPPPIAAPAPARPPAFGDDPVFDALEAHEFGVPHVDFEAVHAEAAKLIDDASAQAEALLRAAQERATALLADTQKLAAESEANAQREGYERGLAEGRAAAQSEMDEMLATMRNLIEMARAERHKIIESAEPEIVRLAVSIAERILHQHVAVDRNAVLEMARSAIMRIVHRETVTVRVNPADIETMREHREQLMAMNDIDNLRIIEDQRVDRGGVVLETEAGTVDAKISTQLREVRRLLSVEDPITVAPAADAVMLNPPAQAS